MTTPPPTLPAERRQGVAAGILILAVGLSVRFPITSVSPLLADIGRSYGLSPSGLAVLSAIPVLLFGLASPLAPLLVSRLGLTRALTALLAALALATLLRPLAPPLLFAGTVVGGAAIALLGILAPQIIRHALPHRGGFWTGVYTTSFGVSAAAGAALSVPVLHLLGERVGAALAAWATPLLVALGLAVGFGPRLRGAGSGDEPSDGAGDPATRKLAQDDGGADGDAADGTLGARSTSARVSGLGGDTARDPARGADPAHDAPPRSPAEDASIFRAPGVWSVTGFFGAQALIYFSLTAWLPTIAADRGMPPAQAGLLLAWMSVAGLPASLLAPTLATRPRLRTRLIIGVAALSAIGLTGLAFGPTSLAAVMVAVLGIAQSAAFGLAIALIVFTAPSAARTASFSAVSQGIGYAFAAAGPLLLGLLAQTGLDWSVILALLVAVALCELVFGVTASRASVRARPGRTGP